MFVRGHFIDDYNKSAGGRNGDDGDDCKVRFFSGFLRVKNGSADVRLSISAQINDCGLLLTT